MVLNGRDPVAGLEGFDEAAGGAKAGFAGDLTDREVCGARGCLTLADE